MYSRRTTSNVSSPLYGSGRYMVPFESVREDAWLIHLRGGCSKVSTFIFRRGCAFYVGGMTIEGKLSGLGEFSG